MAKTEEHELLDADDYLNAEIDRVVRDRDLESDYLKFLSEKHLTRQRSLFLTIAIGATCVLVASALLLLPERSVWQETLAKVLTLTAIFFFFGSAFFYLQPTGAVNNWSPLETFSRTRFYIDQRFAEVQALHGESDRASSTFTEADKAKVLANIQAKLESESLQGYISGLKEIVSTNISSDTTAQYFRSIADRLSREAQDQAKRGNLNLILGIFTTLVGVTVLGYSVFYAPIGQTADQLLAYFVPRVSLVLLIEVFAYFFLRLYKQSLTEIKYFQNEITNIQSRQLATHIASANDDSALRSLVVEELIKTERNFILSKDQTTVELERDRLSRSSYADTLSAAKDAFRRKE